MKAWLEEDVIAIPQQYGLEYELQFMLLDPVTGESKTLPVDLLYQGRTRTALLTLQPAGESLREVHKVDLNLERLELSSDLVKLDLGNFEIINTTPLQTINACVAELNKKVDLLGETLTEVVPARYQFALLLPKCSFTIDKISSRVFNKYGGLKCLGYLAHLGNTKHLNFSYTSQEVAKEQMWRLRRMCRRGKYAGASANGMILEKSCTKEVKIRRLHLRLPYDFIDYEKVFNGELTVEPYRNSRPVLLGHSSKHLLRGKRPWRRINPLV